jgi:hypothetical protein
MAPSASSTAGLVTVRVWVENHPTRPLRVVVSAFADLAGTEPKPDRQTCVTSIEEASSIVREWLTELVDGG